MPVSSITILGAGPGGAFAALVLGRAGISCTILERETFPRDKVCGDALSGKVVEVLRKVDPNLVNELALLPAQLGSWGVTFVAPNRKALRVPFKKEFNKAECPPGFISKRIDFDQWLIRQALKYPSVNLQEGVEAWEFTREKSDETGQVEWQIKNRAGEIVHRTHLVIAADGAHSRFAKQVGGVTLEAAHHCAGLRAYYKGVKGLDEDNFIELHFLKDFLPGYFWIFPLPDGMANVGVGMRSDKVSAKKVNLKKRMLELIENDPGIKARFEGAELVGGIKGYGLPLGSKKRSLSGDGYMLVGDAASLIDPFTGEGIGNAMYSGYFAAQMVITCQKGEQGKECVYSAKNLAAYDTITYQRLWSELSLSKKMQELVRFPWLFNLVVNKAKSNPALSELISCMFEDLDIRERLKNPMFYVKLLLGR